MDFLTTERNKLDIFLCKKRDEDCFYLWLFLQFTPKLIYVLIDFCFVKNFAMSSIVLQNVCSQQFSDFRLLLEKLFPIFEKFLSPFAVKIVSFFDFFNKIYFIFKEIIILLYFFISFCFLMSCHVCIVKNYFDLFP